MKRLTASFTLPSGVPVVCSQLYGDHYEILTSGQYKESDMMLEFILSLLISVGSKVFKHNPENHKRKPSVCKGYASNR